MNKRLLLSNIVLLICIITTQFFYNEWYLNFLWFLLIGLINYHHREYSKQELAEHSKLITSNTTDLFDKYQNLSYTKQFLTSIFNSAKILFPEIKDSTSYIFQNNNIQFLYSSKYDVKVLNNTVSSKEASLLFKSYDKPFVINDFPKFSKRLVGDKSQDLLVETDYSKTGIILGFKFANNVEGGITLGINQKDGNKLSDQLLDRLTTFHQTYIEFYKSSRITETIDSIEHMVLTSFLSTLELYDNYTGTHCQDTTSYSMFIGDEMKLLEDEKQDLFWASLLHDIGKISTSRKILHKKRRLSKKEYEIVKQHSVLGSEVIGKSLNNDNIKKVIRAHHERWDGNGYPDGLAGHQIPLLSRIIAISDAFDALTSRRPYRNALSYEEVLSEILRCKGTQFDPEITDIFINNFSKHKHTVI